MEIPKATEAALKKEWILDSSSTAYLEALYETYLLDAGSVSLEWQHFFENFFEKKNKNSHPESLEIQQELKRLSLGQDLKHSLDGTRPFQAHPVSGPAPTQKQNSVFKLIEAYRLQGHLQADIEPLNLKTKPAVKALLDLQSSLAEDRETVFEVGHFLGGAPRALHQIISELEAIYCGTLACEFMHIEAEEERLWVQHQIESRSRRTAFSPLVQQTLLNQLVAAEGLEKYLNARYPGAKRFSLEGTESLLVALQALVQEAGTAGIQEIILGMAHRGRLNVLVNLLGKKPSELFAQFEGQPGAAGLEVGDVKYHQGFSAEVATQGGVVHVSLAFNPSHLEIVTPVVCGSVKARQHRLQDTTGTEVMAVAIHGDGAFSGQGVVMETLNMAQTRGFNIGGTLHIIVNNQIGFTTSEPQDARSTRYCSDIGKMMNIPIFHVNADDPEAVLSSIQLALAYKMQFKKDVIVDLIGYRRQGHNEADEPSVTQPLMYQRIRAHKTVCHLYAEKLISENTLVLSAFQTLQEKYRASLDKAENTVIPNQSFREYGYQNEWLPYSKANASISISTAVEASLLKKLSSSLNTLPKDFKLHPRVEKIIEDRQKMSEGELALDWGCAEILAYATLLNEGYFVRLSGQDVARGTFFHRHAVLYHQQTGEEWIPLSTVSKKADTFAIVNTLLSEAAVLGFEYGFSQVDPKGLVLWEAQFGDFANNAQCVIDQFMSSGEKKWGRLSGLTLLLPHGYEGQGAEHSSARLERFLQLCAEDNLQVCVPTTPAQMFHLIRRQVLRPLRKPLIVLTPKSLLRHKQATSPLQALSEGTFSPLLADQYCLPHTVTRLIACSGKIYYELLEKCEAEKRNEVALLRLEQLYPFPKQEWAACLDQYPNLQTLVWCQEEPENQGAWGYLQPFLKAALKDPQELAYAGRKASAAPAVGYYALHQIQQETVLKEALGKGN